MQRLMTYDASAQHWGTFLLGYRWNIYGTFTYAKPIGQVGAEATMKQFAERYEKALKSPVSWFGALEHRVSGAGMSGIPFHWHLLAASERPGMASVAEALWRDRFGMAQVGHYDPAQNGAYYVAKLASRPDGVFLFGNLDRLPYHGPDDLISAAHANEYVPAELADKISGRYLRVKAVDECR